jgi:leucyl/phenylalanyl-tRNA---protein transferase
VAVDGLFAAESMFHHATDASKVAVVGLVEHARRVGVTLIDVQVPSPHLATLGACAVPRTEYVALLAEALGRAVRFAA